jgi:uncharacterized protein (TIGR02646 family)
MIAIKKSSVVPEKLQQKQAEIATYLFVKKEKFKWENEHYSTPIKEDLKQLYNNKCGYCEVELTDKHLENQFTVEHYRPKKMYYWLGAEWTNLFPACKQCNSKLKKDTFPLFSERKRFKQNPFDENEQLISDYCKADSEHLKAEQPLYFHPEIDNFEDFFDVSAEGKVMLNELKVEAEIDKKYLKERITKTLSLINNDNAEHQRKKKILDMQKELKRILVVGRDYFRTGNKRDIELLFAPFFQHLKENQQPDVEFSLLGKCMVRDFERFFIEGLDWVRENEGLKKLLRFAYRLHFP